MKQVKSRNDEWVVMMVMLIFTSTSLWSPLWYILLVIYCVLVYRESSSYSHVMLGVPIGDRRSNLNLTSVVASRSSMISSVLSFIIHALRNINTYLIAATCTVVVVMVLSMTCTIDKAFHWITPEETMIRFHDTIIFKCAVQFTGFIVYLSPIGLMGVVARTIPRGFDIRKRHICGYMVFKLVLVIIQFMTISNPLFSIWEVLFVNIKHLVLAEVPSMVLMSAYSDSDSKRDGRISITLFTRSLSGLPFMLFSDVPMVWGVCVMLAVYGCAWYCVRRFSLYKELRYFVEILATFAIFTSITVLLLYMSHRGPVYMGGHVGVCATSEYSRLDRLTGLVDASKCPFNVMFSDALYDAYGIISANRYDLAAYDVPYNSKTISFSKTYTIQQYNAYAYAICRHPFLGFKIHAHFVPQTNLCDDESTTSAQYESTRRYAKPPLIESDNYDILVYLLDAADQYIVQERMPYTIDALKARAHSHFFDFRGYRAIGYNSLPNQMAMLAGSTDHWDYESSRTDFDSYLDRRSKGQDVTPRFLLDFCKHAGYSVSFLDDDCLARTTRHYTKFFPNQSSIDTGQMDAGMFTYACQPLWHPFDDGGIHCLFGETMFDRRHQYILDYFNRTIDQMRGRSVHVPKMAFVNSYEAHTRLPQMLYLYDPEFAKFLSEFGRVNPHAIIIVMADHGLHYLQDDRAHEFPVFLMSVPDSFDGKLIDNMRKNEASGMQFTGFDMYCTLLDLVKPHNHCQRVRTSLSGPSSRYLSLLNDVLYRRTCNDINVQNKLYCESYMSDSPSHIERFPLSR